MLYEEQFWTRTKNKNGIGMHNNATNAKTLEAHWSPSFENIGVLNKGNTLANTERIRTVAAKALAQYREYASIK